MEQRGVSSTRDRNRALVYSLVRRTGPVARKDLAALTDLTKPTITDIVDELVSAGLIEEVGFAPSMSTGGRRPRLLAVRSDSHCVAGIHIGIQRMTVALTDALGNELGVMTTPTQRHHPDQTLAGASILVTDLLHRHAIPVDRLMGVGIALPGLVDFRTGTCVYAPNLGWEQVPAQQFLEDRLAAPVFVHNTAQAIAAAEVVEGGPDAERDVVVLYVGTGVGAGVIAGGRVFHGWSGFAGELGHCAVAGSTTECVCGKRGCLEALVSAPALVRRAQEEISAGASTVLSGAHSLTTKTIAEAAESGDHLARTLLDDAGRQLGVAASWLVNLFNPATLIIAGGVSEIGDLIVTPLRQGLAEGTMAQATRGLVVRRSVLGERAKIRGAVLLALQALDETPRPIFEGVGGPPRPPTG